MLRTKAAVSIEEMGDQYCMIGPYIDKGVKMEVEVEDPVKLEPMAAAVQKMKEYGFRVRSVSFVLVIKARFPLPELTGDRFPLLVSTGRVDG